MLKKLNEIMLHFEKYRHVEHGDIYREIVTLDAMETEIDELEFMIIENSDMKSEEWCILWLNYGDYQKFKNKLELSQYLVSLEKYSTLEFLGNFWCVEDYYKSKFEIKEGEEINE